MKKTNMYQGIGLFLLGVILLSGCAKNNAETERGLQQNISQTSEAKENHSNHNHSHSNDGEFQDTEIKDRTLKDWAGDWQSVYPYLLDGTLNEVLEHKAKEKKDKSFEGYQDYYTKGYKTEVNRIIINENTLEFFKGNTSQKADYHYDGYHILTYDSGKRGVRYLFSTTETDKGVPKNIQFSDHNIEPTKAEHFHLYFGDVSHEALQKELENWPTYYKSELTGSDIVHEMLHH